MISILLAALSLLAPPPTPLAPAPVARYEAGTITAAELERWQRYQQMIGTRANRRQAIEDLVVVEVLASRIDPESETSRSLDRWLGEIEAGDAWLDRHLRLEAQPGETELRTEYEKTKERFHRPKRWRLSNIFLRVPLEASAAERAGHRHHLEGLVDRLRAGEDFASLAEAESDSSTRLRRGDMGFVLLSKLQPTVARVVGEMDVGDLSPILDIPDGLLVLLCTAIQTPESRTFEEARPRLVGRIRSRRLQRMTRDLEDSLLASLSIEHMDPESWIDPSAVLARYLLDRQPRTLTVGEFSHFLRRHKLSEDPASLQPPQRREHVQQLLLTVAKAREGERRGRLDDPDHLLLLEYRDLERRAQLAANKEAQGLLRQPTEEQLKHWIEANRSQLFHPVTHHIRALEARRDPSLGAEFFARLRLAGQRLATGGTGLEQGSSLERVAQEFAPHLQLRDYGWLTDSQIWTLGRNIDHELRNLPAGGFSQLVQEGPKLFLLERVAERPRRPFSAAEARQHAEATLLAAERRRAGKLLRRNILAEQAIEIAPQVIQSTPERIKSTP